MTSGQAFVALPRSAAGAVPTYEAAALRGSRPIQASYEAGVAAPSAGVLAMAATAVAAGIRSVGRHVAVAKSARKKGRKGGGGTAVKERDELPAYKARAPPPFAPAEQVGAMMPLGYFDPLDLCPVGDEGKFRRYREAELKHGRVAMLAAVGMVTQHYVKVPGFENVPAGTLAIETDPASKGWWILIAFCGVLELFVLKQDYKKEVGDFGDPAGLSNIFGYNEDMRAKEINNGRMAMFSAIGILWAEGATNKDGVDQLIAAGVPGLSSMPAIEIPAVPAQAEQAVAVAATAVQAAS
jgi:hypothetical protein